jgi:adenylate cyclase
VKYFFPLNLAIFIASLLLVAGLDEGGPLKWLQPLSRQIQNLSFDLYSRTAVLVSTPKRNNEVVLVDIDDYTLKYLPEFGRWPWRRDFQAYLINEILKQNPRKLIIDIIYGERDRAQIPEGLTKELQKRQLDDLVKKFEPDNELLYVLLKNKKHIILTLAVQGLCWREDCEFKANDTLDPFLRKIFKKQSASLLPALSEEALNTLPSLQSVIFPFSEINAVIDNIGTSATLRESDGVVRKHLNISRYEGLPVVSIPALLNTKSLNPLATAPVPLNFIRFYKHNTFKTYSAIEFIKADPPLAKDLLKDKIVVLGVSAAYMGDIHNTPMGPVPGPEFVATNIANQTQQEQIFPSSVAMNPIYYLLILILFLLHWKIIPKTRAIGTLSFYTFTILLLAAIDFAIFQSNTLSRLIFPILQLIALGLFLTILKYHDEEHHKEFIKKAFSSYLSPKLVEQMIKDPKLLKLGGEKRELTIMFSDIRGFTTFSEKMDPQELSAFLNEYLTAMTDIIFETEGTLDKYIGDAVMAFWGAPVPVERAEFHALHSAIRMMNWIETKRKYLSAKYHLTIEVGIGINTGTVSVGNMGSAKSLGYTVIGDDVNLTSRLEGATKYYGVDILTTEKTLSQLTDSERQSLTIRPLDYLTVKGKQKPIRVYEICHRETPVPHLECFQRAITNYLAQKWPEAEIDFYQAVEFSKAHFQHTDKAAEVFLKRIEFFRANPPGKDWNGAWALDSK